jgi:hypothetical protein
MVEEIVWKQLCKVAQPEIPCVKPCWVLSEERLFCNTFVTSSVVNYIIVGVCSKQEKLHVECGEAVPCQGLGTLSDKESLFPLT